MGMTASQRVAAMNKARQAKAQARIAGGSGTGPDEAPAPVQPDAAVAVMDVPPPDPRATTVDASAAIDAAVLAADAPTDFDPAGTYVIIQGAVGLKYGEGGMFRDPAYYGDLIAAVDGPGVVGLAAPAITSPQSKDVLVQQPTDGVAELKRLWDKGHIVKPEHPRGVEARKNRLRADATLPEGRQDAGRFADLRLHIVTSGGSVLGFASGEKV